MIPRHNTGNPARRDNEVFASEASKALYVLQDFLRLVLDTHTHFVRMSFASLRVMMILLFVLFFGVDALHPPTGRRRSSITHLI